MLLGKIERDERQRLCPCRIYALSKLLSSFPEQRVFKLVDQRMDGVGPRIVAHVALVLSSAVRKIPPLRVIGLGFDAQGMQQQTIEVLAQPQRPRAFDLFKTYTQSNFLQIKCNTICS